MFERLLYNVSVQRKKSKQLISMAIYQLMFTIPYEKITVKMICEKAGVSRMSFYRYYSTKEDVFINFADERFEEFYETYMTNEITLDSFTRDVISYFKKYTRQVKILEKANCMSILITQFERYAAYIMRNAKSLSVFQHHNNPLAVPYYAGAFYNVLVYWSKNNFKHSEEEMTRMLEELLTTRVPLN